MACALAAAQHGARVVLLEKQAQLGGTTGLAIGSFTANRGRGLHIAWAITSGRLAGTYLGQLSAT